MPQFQEKQIGKVPVSDDIDEILAHYMAIETTGDVLIAQDLLNLYPYTHTASECVKLAYLLEMIASALTTASVIMDRTGRKMLGEPR